MECSRPLKNSIVLIKGAGEMASSVAYRLHQSGFRKIVMSDLPIPLAERRGVSFCEALIEGQKEVCGLMSRKADLSMGPINQLWAEGKIPVVADPENKILQMVRPDIFIDGVMAKRNTGTTIADAPLVIALGPGFLAVKDCHFVVETNPASPCLGRVISKGHAEEHTGIPTSVLGLTMERLLRAPTDGRLVAVKSIGDEVAKDETIGYDNSSQVKAQVSGCVWGILRDGITLKKGQKIGDIDPRGERKLCFEISAHARAVAGGVLEGILRFHNG